MFNRILLAIDDTASGQVAVSFAIALGREQHARVRVLHVNELQMGGRGLTTETSDEASRLLDHAVYQLLSAGVEASGLVAVASRFGLPWKIVDEARSWSADMILLGSRRHRHLSRVLGRHTRLRVTCLTQLPVLTAPAPLKVVGSSGTITTAHGNVLRPPTTTRSVVRSARRHRS